MNQYNLMSYYEQIDDRPGRRTDYIRYQKRRKAKLERKQAKNYIKKFIQTEEEQQKFKSPMKGWTT